MDRDEVRRSTMSVNDGALLDRYFRYMGHQARSTAGAQLEVIGQYAVKHVIDPEIRQARREREPWEPDPYQITARPTAETRDFKRDALVDDVLAWNRIGTGLSEVMRADPFAHAILEAVHGDLGACWAQKSEEGSLGALLEYTSEFQRLMRKARAKPSFFNMSKLERQLNLAAGKDTATKLAMAKARVEARALYARACRAWNDTPTAKMLRAREEARRRTRNDTDSSKRKV